MMPPKDVAPSDLWLALSKRPRPHRTVEFPTKDGSVGQLALWILTEHELHTCRANAATEARNRLGERSKEGSEVAYEEIYRNELIVQLVCMACRNISDMRVPAFPTAAIARQCLLTDEFWFLYQAYSLFRAESGPMLSELTPAEMNAWLKVLQEGGSRVPLARLGLEAVIDLLMHSVASQTSSSTGSGSAGLPPDASLPLPTALAGDPLPANPI
jgi:hypothetical protein